MEYPLPSSLAYLTAYSSIFGIYHRYTPCISRSSTKQFNQLRLTGNRRRRRRRCCGAALSPIDILFNDTRADQTFFKRCDN